MKKKQEWEKEFEEWVMEASRKKLWEDEMGMFNELKSFISAQIQQAYKDGYAKGIAPEIKMIDHEMAKAFAVCGEFESLLKNRDENVRAETLKEVRGGRICINCGKPKEGTLTDLCDKCLQEE